MITVAGRIAARYPDRLELVQTDILEYGPGEPLDAICTNLVLHNIPPGPKGELLRRLNDWLVPGGVFVWGDLVRQPDATLEARMVAFRERFARDHGCDEALVEENFRKEGTTDHPLTVPDMVRALAAAG
ncbi:MAG: class I SAM-dependent methyltransferase, partial [Gemmatimonadetes bacterium]|nr:class I SAM-dependent methyltransferase [Gemmatimonadota bacterium]